jgi:methionine biosynthesis protein MetW
VDYDEYWLRRGTLTVVHDRWRIAAELIPDGASVLDVGCGSGQFIALLKTRRPRCTVVGVDVSPNAIEIARAQGANASVLNIESANAVGSFDFVTCLEVLEHIAHAEVALGRIMQATRRQAVVSVPNVGFIGCRLRLGLFGRFPTTSCVFHIREHVRFWTVADFREWVEHYGYRVVGEHPQHGVWFLWRRFPSLFASAMVYVVEHSGSEGTEVGRSCIGSRAL